MATKKPKDKPEEKAKKRKDWRSKPWFRMYAEFAFDPKVQIMPEDMQRRFLMILCLQCSEQLSSLTEEEIAKALKISNKELCRTRDLFLEKGFVTISERHKNVTARHKRVTDTVTDDQTPSLEVSEDKAGYSENLGSKCDASQNVTERHGASHNVTSTYKWTVSNWKRRQFKSDSSAERTRRYRAKLVTSQRRHRDGIVTVPEVEVEVYIKPPYAPLSGGGVSVNGNHRKPTEPPKPDQPPESPPLSSRKQKRKARDKMTPQQLSWFTAWWLIYPKRVSKLDAIDAWTEEIDTPELFEKARAGLLAQKLALEKAPWEKRPHPATWIRGHRWEDEVQTGAEETACQPYETPRRKSLDEISPR